MLNAQCSMLVRFEKGKIRPVGFVREGREYQVKAIPLIYERKDGGRRYMCFNVDCGGMMAELVWDLQNFQWRVGKCAPSCM